MNKAFLIMIALATTALLGNRPAQAYYDGPWCGVYSIGDGSSVEKCDFRNFESCRAEMVAGNRGFCRQNGYYRGIPRPIRGRASRSTPNADRFPGLSG